MSKEQAERFVADWEAEKPELIDALKEVTKDNSLEPEAIVQVAHNLGYEATADELGEQFEANRKKHIKDVSSAELSTDDLEQVAGGYNDRCMYTHDSNEKCFLQDRCWGLAIHYKEYSSCSDTYEDGEECYTDDKCVKNTNYYGPVRY